MNPIAKNLDPVQLQPSLDTDGGFSLLEIMVVVVLIGLMGIFAGADITSFRPNMQLNGVARNLFSDLQNAKMEALKNNETCEISFNQTIGAATYDYVAYLDMNVPLNYTYDAGTDQLVFQVSWAKDYKFISLDTTEGGGDGLTFVNNGAGNPTIAFQPDGLTADPSGNISSGGSAFLVNTTPKTVTVTINRVGNISIQ